MKRNRKETRILLLLILLLGIGIGYAALATTLKIVGDATVKKQTWDVYWANPQVTQGSVSSALPTIGVGEDNLPNTKVSFEVNFNEPGQFYEFTIDAVNNGTIDAMITGIENKVNNTDIDSDPSPLPAYVGYTVTYDDGTTIQENDTLLKKTTTATTKKYKIRVEWLTNVDSSSLGDDELTLNFKYGVTYGQYTSTSEPEVTWNLPSGRTKDNLQVGDEICLDADPTQCFNFIRYDNNDIVMLSKYNLNVGLNSKITATNKQDSDVRGYKSGMTTYGDVTFSTTNYWDDGSGLKPEYGSDWYTNNIYDATNYKEAPGANNYSIAYYVEEYKTILTNLGATIKEARLLKYSEVIDSSIGCNANDQTCPTTGDSAFITNTSFWLGSAYDSEYPWVVVSAGNTSWRRFNNTGSSGVRPVMVIEKSNL